LGSLAGIQWLSRGPGFSLYISQDIKGNAGRHRLHCCGLPSAGANLCVPVAHSLPSFDMRTVLWAERGESVGQLHDHCVPFCVACQQPVAIVILITHNSHRDKAASRCKGPTHTVMNRHSTWAPERSRTISIAAVCSNRLWQCLPGSDWVGQVTFNYSPAWSAWRRQKDSSVALLSKHTTRSAGGWILPFPLESEQKSFPAHHCAALLQKEPPSVCICVKNMCV